MKRKYLLLSILLASSPAFAQNILTLKECYEKAAGKNALTSEKDAYADIWQLKDQNLYKNWLPTLDANGNFVYNSSVVDLSESLGSLPIPGIADMMKPMPHEQYRVTVDVSQVIYDGGATRSARAVERTNLEINQKQTESDLYKLREQINQCYFSLLLLDRQKEILRNYLALLEKRLESLKAARQNGIVPKSDLDVMEAEKIKLEQQIRENEIRKLSLSEILSDLTGVAMDGTTTLMLPPQQEEPTGELSRAELQIFDLRKEQLAATMQVIESKQMPKVFGYATLGLGNPPGSNFFKDELGPYYVVGAGVKWNIFDWHKADNEKQVILLQQGILENRKNDLTEQLSRLLKSKSAEIASLKSLVETDQELIGIRSRITTAAESRYDNGTITATEYLAEMNAETQARIDHEIHAIKLSLAQIEYLNISGKEIR